MSIGKILNPHRIHTDVNGNASFVKKGLYLLNNGIQLITSPYFLFSSHKVRLYDSKKDRYVRISETSSLKGRFFHFAPLGVLAAAGWKYGSKYKQQMPYLLASVLFVKFCSNFFLRSDSVKIKHILNLAKVYGGDRDKEVPLDLLRAESLYKHVAEHGDKDERPEAIEQLYNLAHLTYEDRNKDKGIKPNIPKAEELYKYVVMYGDEEAQNDALEKWIGLFELDKKDSKSCEKRIHFRGFSKKSILSVLSAKMEEIYKFAAKRGIKKAFEGLIELGDLYKKGARKEGVERDLHKAESLYKYVVEHGDEKNQETAFEKWCGLYELGDGGEKALHLYGLNVASAMENQLSRIAKICKFSAEKGVGEAVDELIKLGECYEEGKGTIGKNFSKAIKMYQLAVKYEDKDAEEKLGKLKAKMVGRAFDLRDIHTVANNDASIFRKGLYFLNNSIQFVASLHFVFSHHKVRYNEQIRIEQQSSPSGRVLHAVVLGALIVAGLKYKQQASYILAGVMVVKICNYFFARKDSAEGGDISALAYQYEYGDEEAGIPQDLPKAIALYRSAHKGSEWFISSHLIEIGKMYARGIEGEQKNPAKAQALFNEAGERCKRSLSDKNNSSYGKVLDCRELIKLGQIYAKGVEGIEKNPFKAETLLTKIETQLKGIVTGSVGYDDFAKKDAIKELEKLPELWEILLKKSEAKALREFLIKNGSS